MPHAGKRSSKRDGRSPGTGVFGDLSALTAVLNRALHDALEAHRRLGHAVPAWRGGQVIWIEPEEMSLGHLVRRQATSRGGKTARARNGSRQRSR